jgi:nitrate reductase beta subunit
VQEAASVPDEHDLLAAQRDVFLDPEDPAVQEAARAEGMPEDWIEAARRSPIYDLAMRWGVALPLHPEFRTLPMVWYVPPLSPVASTLETDGYEADPDDVFGAIDNLRIPLEYLASLLTAGDVGAVREVLHRLAAMRAYMRKQQVLGETDESMPARVGLTGPELERMYRLLAIANYEDRYVIPKAHAELGRRLMQEQGGCGLDFEGGPGNCGAVDRRPQTSSQVVPYDGQQFHVRQEEAGP